MKKIILLLVVVAAAAVPAVPYYIGTTVEETFRIEHEEAARDASLSGFDIQLVDYQRNLLNATATTRVSILVPEGKDTLSFDMHHKISHIPQLDKQVIATVESELALGDEVKKVVGQLFKGQAPLTMQTQIFLDGHQEGSIHSPKASGQISGKKSVAIEWQGIEGSAWQSADRNKVTFNMYAPGVLANPVREETVASNDADADATTEEVAADETISMKELRYSGEMQRGESGMWHGNAEASINSISVNVRNPQGMPFSMLVNSIGIKGDQSESNGLISATGALTANSINVGGFLLSNAVYDITVENIDAGAMLAWQQTAGEIMKGTVNPENPFEPMAEHIPALFNAQPVIKINDISVDSPMGRFAFKMQTSVNGQWDDMMLQNPAMVVPMLKVDLEADMPKAIVISSLKGQIRNTLMQQAALSEQEISPEDIEAKINQAVDQQLGAMIEQGFIKESESQLQTHIVFEAGKLTVNGMDASPMLGGMM